MSKSTSEWIICPRNGKPGCLNPETATAVAIATVAEEARGNGVFDSYLRKHRQIAFKMESYGHYFKKRVNLDALPHMSFGKGGAA